MSNTQKTSKHFWARNVLRNMRNKYRNILHIKMKKLNLIEEKKINPVRGVCSEITQTFHVYEDYVPDIRVCSLYVTLQENCSRSV